MAKGKTITMTEAELQKMLVKAGAAGAAAAMTEQPAKAEPAKQDETTSELYNDSKVIAAEVAGAKNNRVNVLRSRHDGMIDIRPGSIKKAPASNTTKVKAGNKTYNVTFWKRGSVISPDLLKKAAAKLS
jgi:hypothetical protein